MVKNTPVSAGDRFNPLFGKIPTEEILATHSSILAWRMPWTEEPGGSIELDTLEQLSMHTWGICHLYPYSSTLPWWD